MKIWLVILLTSLVVCWVFVESCQVSRKFIALGAQTSQLSQMTGSTPTTLRFTTSQSETWLNCAAG